MIYTLTLNPSLDYYMQTENLIPGSINLSSSERLLCGGKGINVCRVLRSLGSPAKAVTVTAGATGELIESMLKAEGMPTQTVKAGAGMSRICVKLRGREETDINGSGPDLDENTLSRVSEILKAIPPEDLLVIAGRPGRGVPGDVFARLLSGVKAKLTADTTGGYLKALLPHRPCLIKPNEDELYELTGTRDYRQGAMMLREAGAGNVLVSLGGRGAYLLCEDGRELTSYPPKIKPLDTTGAGDSMLAGFLAARAKGADASLCLRIATAAGTAACTVLGTAQKKDVLQTAEKITIREDLR